MSSKYRSLKMLEMNFGPPKTQSAPFSLSLSNKKFNVVEKPRRKICLIVRNQVAFQFGFSFKINKNKVAGVESRCK